MMFHMKQIVLPKPECIEGLRADRVCNQHRDSPLGKHRKQRLQIRMHRPFVENIGPDYNIDRVNQGRREIPPVA